MARNTSCSFPHCLPNCCQESTKAEHYDGYWPGQGYCACDACTFTNDENTNMLISNQAWTECDMCAQTKPAAYGHIAQGASGRWCVVMSSCSDCVAEGNYADEDVHTPEAARDYVNSLPNSWADF